MVFRLARLAAVCFLFACGSDRTNAVPSPVPDAGVPTVDAGAPTADAAPPPRVNPCKAGAGVPVSLEAYVAEGMCARLIAADGVDGLRQIQFAPNGDLFGTTNGGTILLFRDANGDGAFTKDEIHTWGQTGGNGSNAHIDVAGGFVYSGGTTGVKRFPYDPAALAAASSEDVVVGQPADGFHPKHTSHVYDGFLYVHSGSSDNSSHEDDNPIGEYDTTRALIKRFDLSKFTSGAPFNWKDGEIVIQGIRNAVGVARNETTGKIYAVVNGIDNVWYPAGVDIHNDNPGEQIVEVVKGKQYGYPFCFTAQRILNGTAVVPPGTQLYNPNFSGNPHDDAWCALNSAPPVTFLQAHSAPNDMLFFDKQPSGNLPEKWRGGAFFTLHGSWDRAPSTGYSVIWQPFNADGSSPMPTSTADTTTFPYQVVFGGADEQGNSVDGNWQWHTTAGGDTPRPAGVAISPIDGSLYVSADTPGSLYRIGIDH